MEIFCEPRRGATFATVILSKNVLLTDLAVQIDQVSHLIFQLLLLTLDLLNDTALLGLIQFVGSLLPTALLRSSVLIFFKVSEAAPSATL